MNISIPQIAVDLVLNIINILVLFFVTKLLVYKPVKKFLDERKAKINEQTKQAQELLDKAKETEAKRDEILRSGEEQCDEIIADATKKARLQANEIIERAKVSAAEIESEAKAKAKKEKAAIMESSREEIANLAVSLSEKILKREVSAEDNKRTVEEFFADGEEE